VACNLFQCELHLLTIDILLAFSVTCWAELKVCVCLLLVYVSGFIRRLNLPVPVKKHTSKNESKLISGDLQMLMHLGYTQSVSVYALEACRGNVNDACNMLLEYG